MTFVWSDCRNPWNTRHNLNGLFRPVANLFIDDGMGLRVVTDERFYADITYRNQGMFGPKKAHASRLIAYKQLREKFQNPAEPEKWSLSLTWRWYDLYHYVEPGDTNPYHARTRGDRTQRIFLGDALSREVMQQIIREWDAGTDIHDIRTLWLRHGENTKSGSPTFVKLFFGHSQDLSSRPLDLGGGPS